MKQFSLFIILLLAILSVPLPSFGTDIPYHHIFLTRVDEGNVNPSTLNDNERGTRQPSTHIECIICKNYDIYISEVDIDEIKSFCIYNTLGHPMEIYTDREEFIDRLFSYQNQIEIRFVLKEYSLIGHISQ